MSKDLKMLFFVDLKQKCCLEGFETKTIEIKGKMVKLEQALEYSF